MHENLGEARTAILAGPGKRDLRLDLLRGIGQWMVFLDHIPYNFLNWFTLRNYGFSDAAEIFVFISGYSIGFSYGPAVKADQFLGACPFSHFGRPRREYNSPKSAIRSRQFHRSR
jgi:hypothetical protein